MRAIKIDENRNPIIINSKFIWVYNIDVIAQNCDQAMRQQLGELNYNKDKGLQYFDNVFLGNPNFQRFEAQARAQILNVIGVTGIESFEYTFSSKNVFDRNEENNILRYTININTIYGATTIANNV
jgi:hypothetical protein